MIVTGSRSWGDARRLAATLDVVLDRHPDLVLVHGACPAGADALADAWATMRGLTPERHPARWNLCSGECPQWHIGRGYCPTAGYRRNTAMAMLGADLCIAFHRDGSTGTAHMIAEARRHGIPVKVVPHA